MSTYLLKKYKKDVVFIKQRAKTLGLSDKEINAIIRISFSDLKNLLRSSKPTKEVTKAQIICRTCGYIVLLFSLLCLCFYIVLNVHQPTSSIVLRNVQGLTYPMLRIIRQFSVPILKLFPSLSDLYDESCLLENPYFYVADMECWPCENVNAILNITSSDQNFINDRWGAPFVIKTDQDLITFQTLQDLYNGNKNTFDLESRRMMSTDHRFLSPSDLFNYNSRLTLSSNTHISWRINKMMTAGLIRQVFKKPSFLSDRSGQSVERFIFIDGVKAEPYLLPTTECSYAFLIQGSGERTIVLKPSKECSNKCKTVSVVLKPSYILWYNWWYWRPISLPTKNSTEPSISYMNSHC